MLKDRFGRILKTLRVSVTDRCDLRCVYCMPAEGARFAPEERLLSAPELARLLALFARLGMTRFKFTGGEPLLQPRLEEALAAAKAAGAADLSLTTNGTRLAARAEGLKRAGLDRVTVSLDSLDPERFRAMTRGGDLEKVWAGMLAAEQAGLGPLKVNAVLMQQGRAELLRLAETCLSRGWQLRFIEYMPMTAALQGLAKPLWDGPSLRLLLRAHFGELRELVRDDPGAPARLFEVPGLGTLGFIEAISKPFCASCDRLRLSAEGFLKLCMARPDGLDLRALLRGGADEPALEEAVRGAAWLKPSGHAFYTEAPEDSRAMSQIGG